MKNKMQKMLSVLLACSILLGAFPASVFAQKSLNQTRQEMKALASELAQKLTKEERIALGKILIAEERVHSIRAARAIRFQKEGNSALQVLGSEKAVRSFNHEVELLLEKREWPVSRYIHNSYEKTLAPASVGRVLPGKEEGALRGAYKVLEEEVLPAVSVKNSTYLFYGETPQQYVERMQKPMEDFFNRSRDKYAEARYYEKSWNTSLLNREEMAKKIQTEQIGKISGGKLFVLKDGKFCQVSPVIKTSIRKTVLGLLVFAAATAAAPDLKAANMARRMQQNPELIFSLNDEELDVVQANEPLRQAAEMILNEAQILNSLSSQERAEIVEYVNGGEKAKQVAAQELRRQLGSLTR